VDFSEASHAAAVEAVALARHLHVPVTLVHAVVRLPLPSIWDVRLVPTDAERESQAAAAIRTLAASFGSPEPGTVAAIAEPAELMARESTPDALVALGLGDREGHRPGSTALRIMAGSHLPVLGIPKATFSQRLTNLRLKTRAASRAGTRLDSPRSRSTTHP
jgi:hypothetical protein